MGVNLGQLCAIRHVVFTPSFPPEDIVSHLQLLVLRLYDLPHAATIERLAHLKRLDITGLVEHTSAHIRVNGHIEVAHQHLAGTRCGDRNSREFEVALARQANGTVLQTNFTTYSLSHGELLLLGLIVRVTQVGGGYCGRYRNFTQTLKHTRVINRSV